MPTYEYRCPKGHHFELFQKMSEEPRADCPECGSESERLLSGGAGFLFKGDGFYITDSRSESYKKEASKESSDGLSESSKTGESKGKSKKGPKLRPGKQSRGTPTRSSSSGGGSLLGWILTSHVRHSNQEGPGARPFGTWVWRTLQVHLERPRDPAHGDWATNLPLTLASRLEEPPRDIAQEIVDRLDPKRGGGGFRWRSPAPAS